MSLTISQPCFAAEPSLSSGLSVGINLGLGTTTSENDVIRKSTSTEQASYQSGSSGLTAGLFISYLKIIHSALLGAMLFYQHYAMNGGSLSVKDNFELHYFEPNYGIGAAFLAGYLLQQHLFMYLFLGPQWTNYQYSMTERGNAEGVFNNTAIGLLYGIGMLIPLVHHISVGARYGIMSSATFDRTLPAGFVTNSHVRFRPTISLFELSLMYSFG